MYEAPSDLLARPNGKNLDVVVCLELLVCFCFCVSHICWVVCFVFVSDVVFLTVFVVL